VVYNKITLSGQICTGKTTLYQALGKVLGWQTFSTGQFFRQYAAKHHLDIEAAQEQNEQITKKIDYQVRDLLKTKKNIIVEGWLAGIMASNTPGVLRVLLTCQTYKRVQRFSQREKISIKEAKKRVRERDSNWLAEIKKIYGRTDIFDPKHYDLVIDTTDQKPKAILQQVLNVVQ
jgi:predicted cytidylate kinase